MGSADPRPFRRLVAAALALAISSPVFAADADDSAAVRDYAVAAGLQNRKLYAQAAERWEKFLKDHAADARVDKVLHHLGTCKLQDGKFPESVTAFRTLLTKYPAFATADASRLNLGLALYGIAQASKKPDDFKAAAAVFAEIPAKHAASKHAPSALYYQAECLYSAGDAAGSAAVNAQLVTAHPASELAPAAYYSMGTAYQDLGKEADAAAAFGTFLTKFPKDQQADECRLRLGLSMFNQKKYAEAIAPLATVSAVANFAYADLAILRQAQCEFELNRPAPAAALYRSVPAKFPKSPYVGPALLSAGKCLYKAEQFVDARTVLADAVSRKLDESAEAAYWLGRSLIKLGKPAEAAAEMEKASTEFAKSPWAAQIGYARVEALYDIPEKRVETAKLFADFAAKFPEHELAPRAAYMAALAALKTGKPVDAQTLAGAFLTNAKFAKHELTPEVLFVGGEGFVLAEKPEHAKAEALYRRLLTEHPQHAHSAAAKLRVGLCLYSQKKFDDAAAFLQPAVATLTDKAQQAEAQLLIGLSLSDSGKPAPAAAALLLAAAAKPDWTRGDEVLLALAAAQRANKVPADATATLVKLNTAFPKSAYRDQALHLLGEIAYTDGKFDEAAARYGEVAAGHPTSPLAAPARFGVAASHFAKADYAKAVEAAGALLTHHPKSELVPRAQYVRGLASQRLKQFTPAAADLAAFLATKPAGSDADDARFALGLCQAELKQYDAAATTFAALLKDRPDFAQADQVMYELGFALKELKKDKESADTFAALAAKYPASARAAESQFRVGGFHEEGNRLPEAAVAYAAGVKLAKPGEMREKLQYKLGWVLHKSDKFAEAAAVLVEQLKDQPAGALAIDGAYLAGECLFRAEKFADALPLLAKPVAAKAEKYHARALYRTGAATAALKQWVESASAYDALLKAFPKFELVSEARYGLGWALQNQNKLAEAMAVYELVTKETNTETAAKARFMVGECEFAAKKFDKAVLHFLEAAVGYAYPEWQALGHFEAGRCFIELKDNEKALRELEAMVSKFPSHPRAKDAKALIADIKSKVTAAR